MNMKKIIGALAVVIIIAGLVLGHVHKKSTTSGNTEMAGSSTSIAATITYSDSGFSPALVTVKANDTVAIKNTSSQDVQLDSDPHPVHTDDTDLNVGQVSPGQTKTFMVMKKGSFGYHNHLDPSQTGRITIN